MPAASTRASASWSGARSRAGSFGQVPPRREAPEGARHLTDWNEPPVRDEDADLRRDRGAVEIAEAHGVSAAQVALAWLLGRPGVSSLVIGARTEEQLADNLAAAELELTAEERPGSTR